MKKNEPGHRTPVEILKADHEKVKGLFEEFEKATTGPKKERIVKDTILELTVHAAVEETVFYPEARKKLKSGEGEDLMDEAVEEHHVVKLLMKELSNMSASDDRYDAKYTVLAENVKHHIREEEGDMFPKITKSPANSEEIGEKMLKRKHALMDKAVSPEKEPKKRPQLMKQAA